MGVIGLLTLLALPAPPGWSAGGLEVYDTATEIYAAINGAADLYFAYGLEQMQVREYTRGDELEIEVELYELGEPLDAFGVLQRERPRSAKTFRLGGAEAAVSDRICVVRRGRFYVKAKAFRGALDATSCTSLLKPVIASLDGGAEPTELARLPAVGRVAVGYARERFLGLSSLSRCLHADYQDGSRVFILVRGNWSALGDGWSPVGGEKVPTVRREIPYTGWVYVARTEDGILGAVLESSDTALTKLRTLTGE